MFYLMMHSIHFIYVICHQTYGKVHSDERGNLLPPLHGLVFLTGSRQDNTAFVTPVVVHWLEREIAQWVR